MLCTCCAIIARVRRKRSFRNCSRISSRISRSVHCSRSSCLAFNFGQDSERQRRYAISRSPTAASRWLAPCQSFLTSANTGFYCCCIGSAAWWSRTARVPPTPPLPGFLVVAHAGPGVHCCLLAPISHHRVLVRARSRSMRSNDRAFRIERCTAVPYTPNYTITAAMR